MTTTTSQGSRLGAWYAATRPRTLVAALVPMSVAGLTALDDGVFRLWVFLLALLGVMLLQTAANLINEYMDYRRGADTLKQAGQGMIIKNQVLTPDEVRNGAVLTTLAGCLIGLFLLSQSGPLLWLIGIGGVLVAITYTAGPYPLAYHGLGEVAAGVFMGPMIVLGGYYVMHPALTVARGLELIAISLPVMLTTAAILHANNIRDLDADRAAGKHTLAVRLGLQAARHEYRLLVGGAYVLQLLLVLLGLMPPTVLFAYITIPEALRLIRVIDTETDVAVLHMAQGGTARLHGRIGLWLALGWLLWLIIRPIF